MEQFTPINFTLRQLEVFEAVARVGTVSGAAEELHLSQPAVSMAIRSFEKVLGVALFERTNRGLELTEVGRSLRPRVHSVLGATADLGRGLNALLPPTKISVAASATIAYYLMDQVLSTHLASHPQVAVQVTAMNSMDVIEGVDNLEYDFGMIEIASVRPTLDVVRWGTQPLQIVCGPDHPLANQGPITSARLSSERWLLPPRFVDVRREFSTAFVARAGHMNVALESSSWTTLKRMAAQGFGLACLPHAAVGEELAAGALIPIEASDFNVLLPLSTIRRRDARQNEIVLHMLDSLAGQRPPQPDEPEQAGVARSNGLEVL